MFAGIRKTLRNSLSEVIIKRLLVTLGLMGVGDITVEG